MTQIFNIWEMGSELDSGSKFRIPNFCLAKYMVLRLAPPKTKTVRDGLVMTAGLLSYTNAAGEEIKMTEVVESIGGYDVTFLHGKTGIMATKYRGPSSIYKFINPSTKKFYQISNEKFTLDYAVEYLAKSTPDWEKLTSVEQDSHVDEYFENMYMFGMSNDFMLDVNEQTKLPKPGMVTSFYRRYTPPKEGEKYGNVIITKWPSKKNSEEASFESLTGDYKEYNEAVGLAVYDELIKRETTPKFDPTSFEVADDDEDPI